MPIEDTETKGAFSLREFLVNNRQEIYRNHTS